VGAGYVLKLRPDSHGVKNTVTVDLCGFVFRSEGLRTARLQVNYARPASALKVSNEVVFYRPGGAAEALREVRLAVAHCPRGPVKSTIAGVGPLTYRIRPLAAPNGLLPGAITLTLHVSGTMNGQRVATTSAAIYQVRGNVLSGVYGYGNPLAAQTTLALHAAVASATNLRAH
jgi:hypothetical protein